MQILRAVIADDSPVQLEIARGALRSLNIQVVKACTNGLDAWAAIQEHKPELAVLDYIMPGLKGSQVAMNIRNAKLPTKVIMATSMGQEKAAYAIEYDALLIKPYTKIIVAAALAKAFANGIH